MKIKKLFINRRTFIPLCALAALVCFIPVISDVINKTEHYGYETREMIIISDKRDNIQFIEEMNKNTVAEQTFICDCDSVSSIVLYGATYFRVNHGTIHIELLNEDDTVIDSWDIDAVSIGDHSGVTLQCRDAKKKNDMMGKKCRLFITSDSLEGDAVTFGYAVGDQYPDGQLFVNENEISGDLIMTVSGYTGAKNFNSVRIRICLHIMILLELLLLWTRYQIISKQK